MSKVKESAISNCEKKFLIKSLSDFRRLDDRAFDEFRELRIEFGKDWGSCHVSLGKTKILAQVTCEVQQPKSSRPSEGVLNINLELNPIAAPHFEAGRQSELSVQLNRLLEKCIKDSKTIDLESLCIRVNEKVWAIRVDVNVLNHEGNLQDCASIAALSALAHFRRPDVTWEGEEFIIHSSKEKDPIPIVIHHYPVCVSYAIFNNGEIVIADPSVLEENVAEGYLTVGLNSYRELCCLHFGGKAQVDSKLILDTTKKAAGRAATVIQQIKECIEKDIKTREQAGSLGFQYSLNFKETETNASEEKIISSLDEWQVKKNKKKPVEAAGKKESSVQSSIETVGKTSAVLLTRDGDDQLETWSVSSEDEVEEVANSSDCQMNVSKATVEISTDDSEEESVIVLNANNRTKHKMN